MEFAIGAEVGPGRSSRALHRFAVFTAFCTFLLIIAGALVKSTGSGLAVPDWPLSYGSFFPRMVGGVFFEHGHRMIASFVGLLVTILATWLVHSEKRKWVRYTGLAAMTAVVCQGLLGGLTVLLRLPPIVSICHAGMAEIFFAIVVSLAFFTSPSWPENPGLACTGGFTLRVQCALTALLVYVQIILGALVRHYGAGLSIPDFPLAYGRVIPTIDSFYVGIHFAHRVGALLVTLAIVGLIARIFAGGTESKAVKLAALALVGVLFTQLTLGAYIIWTGRAVPMTAGHVAVGALTWALCVSLTILSHREALTSFQGSRA